MNLRYGGPMEAVVGVFDLMIEYVQPMASVKMGAVLLVGGSLAGAISEWTDRRWS